MSVRSREDGDLGNMPVEELLVKIESSDVDLLIATPASGMRFYDLVESIREGLLKKVDVLNFEQLHNNPELMNEILKDGIKIYG